MSTFWQLQTRSAAQSLIPEAQTSGIFQSSKHRLYAGETSNILHKLARVSSAGITLSEFFDSPYFDGLDDRRQDLAAFFEGSSKSSRNDITAKSPLLSGRRCFRMACIILFPASTLRRVRRSLPAPMSGAAKGSPPRTSARWYRARRCIACRDSPRLPRSRTTW